jgi:hypothetical protein
VRWFNGVCTCTLVASDIAPSGSARDQYLVLQRGDVTVACSHNLFYKEYFDINAFTTDVAASLHKHIADNNIVCAKEIPDVSKLVGDDFAAAIVSSADPTLKTHAVAVGNGALVIVYKRAAAKGDSGYEMVLVPRDSTATDNPAKALPESTGTAHYAAVSGNSIDIFFQEGRVDRYTLTM